MKFPVMGIEESARQKCIPLITDKKCYNDKCMALQLQMLQIVYHFEKKILQRRCRTHQLHAVRHIISISNYYGLKKYRYYLTEGCADPSSERNIEKNCTRDVDVYNVLKCISTNHSARQLDM